MGEKNDVFCAWLEKAEIFSDFMNGAMFAGKQKILPAELEPTRRDYHEKERKRGEAETAARRRRSRDVVKKRCLGGSYCVLAVENQAELHYAMPVRCMEYDAMEYTSQLRRIRERHRRNKDLKGSAQFLSGMTREEKLDPVTTLVFYHGEGEWNACRDLHDMLNFTGENEMFRKYTANYRINLVTLADLQEERFETGLREVIGMMKRGRDKDAMREYCRKNEERFRRLDEETYDVISVMIHHRKLEDYKENCRVEKGRIDMCQALEEMMEDSRQEGRQEGLLDGEKRLADLVSMLLATGRVEDIRKAMDNSEFRRELYRECGIDGGSRE